MQEKRSPRIYYYSPYSPFTHDVANAWIHGVHFFLVPKHSPEEREREHKTGFNFELNSNRMHSAKIATIDLSSTRFGTEIMRTNRRRREKDRETAEK